MAEMGRRRRRGTTTSAAWPLALSLLLFFISEVESFHPKITAYMQEASEKGLLKAQKPSGGARGGGSSGNGADAGTDNNGNGGTPGSSSSTPYGKVIPVVAGAAVASSHHHKGNADCLSCNYHFPVVFSITTLSALGLALACDLL